MVRHFASAAAEDEKKKENANRKRILLHAELAVVKLFLRAPALRFSSPLRPRPPRPLDTILFFVIYPEVGRV